MIASFVRGDSTIVLSQKHASKEHSGTIYFLNRNSQLISGLVTRTYKKGLPSDPFYTKSEIHASAIKRILNGSPSLLDSVQRLNEFKGFPEMVQRVYLNFLNFICIILCIQIFLTDAGRAYSVLKKGQRRQSIGIGEFPDETDTKRQGRPGQNGDVYEFHRFQHYGFKTPAPNTFSLESMLAFLAPLATLPIIASAALSSMAAILPTLTTEGMVKGRSRREAVLGMLDSTISFNSSKWEATSNEDQSRERDIRDLDIIHKYLKQMSPKADYNDQVMASYLQCSGMFNSNNHCLERLACQFSDNSSKMPALEKDVSSLIIYTILNNKFIKADFKERLRKAAFYGRDTNGQCGSYFCSRNDFRTM
ncbi:uncharacterized protein NPIL_376891 [Nephila pilipes]|uniref:Uncharacterized protein n=1 Tax=Nephila pilipes TaxID=299642 RepID=A0A8X6T985_NEPPI|nr:uncharacterized protein NPIL_376891 [Nephila pilipes]